MPLKHTASGLEKLTGLAILAAIGCWVMGISLPILTVTKFFVFSDAPSLIGMVLGLFEAGDFLIAVIVLLFTILLPLAKLLLGAFLWWFAKSETRLARSGLTFLELVGKWAMLDVLVVAMLVVTLKTSWIADFRIAAGLYWFASSALLAVVAGIGLRRAATANRR